VNKWKSALLAGVAAAIVEATATAVFMGFGRIGGDGPNLVGAVGIALHIPGIMIADYFRLAGDADTAVIIAAGFLQYFLIFWLAIAIIQKRREKHFSDLQQSNS
jgi:hypothetical protein